MPANERASGGLTILDKGLNGKKNVAGGSKRKGSSTGVSTSSSSSTTTTTTVRVGSRVGSRPTSNSGSSSRPTSQNGVKTTRPRSGPAAQGGGLQMLSPEAPTTIVSGAAVTSAEISSMMARRTRSAGSSAAKLAKVDGADAAAVGVGGGRFGEEEEPTTAEELKILEAEDLVRELDALLAEKEQLENEIKGRRGGKGGAACGALDADLKLALEGLAASGNDAMAAAGIAREANPTFFTETGDVAEDGGDDGGDDGACGADAAAAVVRGGEGTSGSALVATKEGKARKKRGSVGGAADSSLSKTNFLQRNIALAGDAEHGALAMTTEERDRVKALMGGDDGEEGDEEGGGAEGGDEANPFAMTEDDGKVGTFELGLGQGYALDGDVEGRLEEIDAQLANFAEVMRLTGSVSGFGSGDGDDIDRAPTPLSPMAESKTHTAAGDLLQQQRLAQIDEQLAALNADFQVMENERIQQENDRTETLDPAVLQKLVRDAQEETRMFGEYAPPAVGAAAAASAYHAIAATEADAVAAASMAGDATAGVEPIELKATEADKAVAAAGITRATGGKAVFF
jgi:hypothetical protein